MDHVIAVLGAGLTREHIVLLSRYTDHVYLCFDNDEAGTKAIARAKKLARPDFHIIEKRVPAISKDLDEYLDKKFH